MQILTVKVSKDAEYEYEMDEIVVGLRPEGMSIGRGIEDLGPVRELESSRVESS